jgi:hypothetical protein
MSMSEPLLPKPAERNDSPAAAEPGPGAPGTPSTEAPDVLPDTAEESSAVEQEGTPQSDPPFRTPDPGDRLTASDLENES